MSKSGHISFIAAHYSLYYCFFFLLASCSTNHSDRSQTVSVNTILYFSSWFNENGCHMSLAICQSGYCMFVVMVEKSTMTSSSRFVCLETDLAFSQCHLLIWKSVVSQTNLLWEDECFFVCSVLMECNQRDICTVTIHSKIQKKHYMFPCGNT